MMDNRRTSQSRRSRDRRTTPFLRCELMECRQLLSTLWVTNTNDDTNPNSLRWAILQANSGSGSDTIDFDIPASGPVTIDLSAPLPALINPVMIDGTTEKGYDGAPLIEIDGSGLPGTGNSGLILSGGGSTIQGLAIVGFSGSAIELESGGGNVVDGNYLGVTPGGTESIANGQGLAIVGSSLNTIGVGASGGAGNVISGNTGDGILIEPAGTQSSSNVISGNWIGTTAGGGAALGNTLSGMAIEGSPNNMVGSPGQGLGNVVSGNLGAGISVTGNSSGTLIQNNIIGLAEGGKTPLGNVGDGIQLDDAPGTVVGGTEYSDCNVIGSNQGDGINTSGLTTGLLVAGNFIGTDTTGQFELGNLGNGISLGSSSNTIGGSGVGAANLIEFNGTGSVGAGVELVGDVDHDLILSNSIYANAGLGINMGSGPTPNHAPGTVGPNDYQNYPTLAIAQSDGSETIIQGSLYESPNTSYLIQFFSSPTQDPSGHGQGKVLLGATTVTTDASGNGSFTKQVPSGTQVGEYISATATSPADDTSEFSSDVAVQGQINLEVTGSATPDPVEAGGAVTYSLTVANIGYLNADDVVLTDQLPGGVAVSSVTTSQGFVSPTMSSGSITVNLGTVAAGASASVTIVVQTEAGAVGTMVDTATVTSAETDPNTSGESATIATSVLAAADLSVSLDEGPAPALAGGDLTYTITVANAGPNTAGDVVATLPLAPGASFVSASTGVGSVSDSGGEVVADLGNLAVNTPVTVTVVLQATAVGELTETASVSGDVIDSNPADETATVTTEINPATDLAVQISSSVAVAGIGQDFQYIVTATNIGPISATEVALSDTLPAGVSFVSAAADQGDVPILANGAVSVTFATLGVGESVRLIIVVDPTAPPGATLIDSASVSGQQADPNPDNNAATLDLAVQSVSDLGVVATAQAAGGTPLVGQPLTYTIIVSNQGPAAEPDAVLSGALPPGMGVDSMSSTQGAPPTIDQGLFTADLGLLPAGATATVTVVASPGPTDTGPITAGFSVQGLNVDPDPSNNSAQVTVDVAPATDLSVAISPGPGPAVAQTDWAYTLVVTNPGPSGASDVVATSTLPPDVQFISASSSMGVPPTEQNGTITADLGSLAVGGSATITIVVQPTTTAANDGSIVISATVAGTQADPDADQAQASLTEPVAPSVSLAVSLSATPETLQSGQMITFTATVTNLGTTPATDVSLMLPALNGLIYGSPSLSQGTAELAATQSIAQFGTMNPGASVTLTELAMATTAGTFTQSASLSDAQYNLDTQGASASTTAVVQESAGIVQFGTASISVNNVAGVAEIPVVRMYGTYGSITVNYQTIAVDATPGVDYVTTVGTLTLGPGQSSASIAVPVLNDLYENHNDLVNVVLSNPSGGATLGGVTTADLQIVDTDPDVTPPQVTGLTWAGSSREISNVTLTFSAPLDPSYATNPANYQLEDLARGISVGIASISYNPSTFAVTVVPASPLLSGAYDQIQVMGTGATAIRDLAGNLLSGNGSGAAGSNYVASFAQGTRLQYVDDSGNLVTLQLKGAGYLEQVRNASGEGVLLDIVGMVPHKTTLKGTIKVRKRSSGQTELGTISGLGQFGDVRVLLKTPPFQVKQLPFQKRGVGVL
jgi:uncharacterized repeat protein (TIGR01451 family)